MVDVNLNVNGLRACFEFRVHVDGAGFEDLTYRLPGEEPDPDGRQSLRLHVLA